MKKSFLENNNFQNSQLLNDLQELVNSRNKYLSLRKNSQVHMEKDLSSFAILFFLTESS